MQRPAGFGILCFGIVQLEAVAEESGGVGQRARGQDEHVRRHEGVERGQWMPVERREGGHPRVGSSAAPRCDEAVVAAARAGRARLLESNAGTELIKQTCA